MNVVTLENDFEYVLPDDSLGPAGGDDDSTRIGEEFQNVVYAGGSTVLLGGNEYYIQTGDGETFIVNNNDNLEDLYVHENEQSEDDTVQYVEDDTSSVVYKVGGKRLKMENGKFLTCDGTERFEQELGVLNEVANSDGSIQYAVLKDGQLHLQISENDTVEILNNQDFIDAESHLEVQLYTENEAADALNLTNIKGRNVLTGKTVSLDDYFGKTPRNGRKTESGNGGAFLNQKFTIGRKSNGKYLVGKILNIQPADNKGDIVPEDNAAIESGNKIQEIVFDASGNILEVADSMEPESITEEQLGFVSKTLNGLTEMSSIQKKLIGKLLDIKLIEKRIDDNGERVRKINGLSGFLTEQINEDDIKYYIFSLADISAEETDDKDITTLVIVTTTDGKGQKTTRVTFTDKARQISRLDDAAASPTSHRNFACDFCGRRFTSQNNLRRHSAVHDVFKRIKTFECSVCGERFLEEGGLFEHVAAHDEAVLRCCQCDKSFGSAAELGVHKKSYHPPKCYYCETCGRQFSRHSNLLRHEEIHGGQGNLHKCTICGCSYKFISSLTRHVVQNHVKKF